MVGGFAAYDEYIEFELKNNNIYFKNEVCPNAYHAESQKFFVEIEKGAKDLPIINGLVLLKGKLEGFYSLINRILKILIIRNKTSLEVNGKLLLKNKRD